MDADSLIRERAGKRIKGMLLFHLRLSTSSGRVRHEADDVQEATDLPNRCGIE